MFLTSWWTFWRHDMLLTVWRTCFGVITNFMTSWRIIFFRFRDEPFDIMTYFWHDNELVWHHNELFDIMTYFWHHDECFDAMMCSWCYDDFFFTSWRFLRLHDEFVYFVTCFWSHDELCNVIMNFLTSW